VVSPKYRIYVTGNDKLLSDLKSKLENHETFFTPYLGISEFIASINYIGEFEGEEVKSEVFLDSVAYIFDEGEVRFENGLNLFRETHAITMNDDRMVQQYSEVVYEKNCKKIPLLKNAEQSMLIKVKELNEVIMLV